MLCASISFFVFSLVLCPLKFVFFFSFNRGAAVNSWDNCSIFFDCKSKGVVQEAVDDPLEIYVVGVRSINVELFVFGFGFISRNYQVSNEKPKKTAAKAKIGACWRHTAVWQTVGEAICDTWFRPFWAMWATWACMGHTRRVIWAVWAQNLEIFPKAVHIVPINCEPSVELVCDYISY